MLGLGRWLFVHKRLVLAIWILGLIAAAPFVPRVFRSLNAGGFDSPDLEAFRAGQLLNARFGSNQSNLVLVYDDPSNQLSATDPRFSDAVDHSLAEVRTLPGLGRIVTARDDPRQVSPDSQAQYVTIELPGA